MTKTETGSRWIARRELKFQIGKRQVTIAVGQEIPAECWATLDTVRVGRLRDPQNRFCYQA
jgi:hypothetical protein